ncbi:DUF2961 domain-containing protein [Nocardia takedensis]|uniref:DUF2961 domain-containing protein n=1 Tax=Nocardia takedensis TaxID=259390 RepID=UPI000304425F|nr:DUF2961 domain-containing protein [Nocardia takedensis]
MNPIGLEAITAFDRLPYLKRGTFAAGQSSYDRAGSNKDFNQYLGTDSHGDHIILDVEGPGVVYRLWFTGFPPEPFPGPELYIRIYLDGSSTARPRPLAEIFSGATAPFEDPLVDAAGKALTSYLPIPFGRSIRITTNAAPFSADGSTDGFFYNIGYHLYGADTVVRTWTEREDIAAAKTVWEKTESGEHPSPSEGATTTSRETTLPAHHTEVLAELRGPGTVESLRVYVGWPLVEEALLDIAVRMWWDDFPEAAVDAPIGMFFALGMFGGVVNARSMVAGVDPDGWLYCHFPMPFLRRARIALINRMNRATELKYSIRTIPLSSDAPDIGYFRTSYRLHSSQPQQSMELLDIRGAGHLVGTVVSLAGPRDLFYLEGDERIYIDGARTAAIHGTGTEDFFNGAWYFRDGAFNRPLHGCTTKSTENGLVSAYRLFIHDAVPFRSRLKLTLEHGGDNEVPVTAWTLAYFYHQPVLRSWQVDAIVLADASSRTAHDYRIEGDQTWMGKVTANFEGDYARIEHTDSGYAHRGRSRFTLAVPPHNTGVVLRRLSNLRIADQKARVSVDSVTVGIWFVAGGAHGVGGKPDIDKWSENDFFIPRAHTGGRSSIDVDIDFVSSAWDWNEFRYTAFALTETPDAYPRLISARVAPTVNIGAVSRSSDHLDLLVADTAENTLATLAWAPSHDGPWLRWPAPSTATLDNSAPVHLVSRSTDKLDGFFTTDNGEIHTASWEPGTDHWRSGLISARLLPGSGSHTPAVASGAHITAVCKQRDHLDIFAATDSAVHTAAWPSNDPHRPADWIGWWTIPGLPARPHSRVEAVSRGQGKIDLFTVHTEHGTTEIHTAGWHPGSATWTAGRLRDRMQTGAFIPKLPPDAVVTAISRRTDHLDIFVIDYRGVVYTAAWEPLFASWRGWWTLPGITGVPGGTVAVVSRSLDKIDLFTTDATGDVTTASWQPQTAWTGGRLRDRLAPSSNIPQIADAAPITAVSYRTDSLDIFVAGTDQRIWTASWDTRSGPTWYGWRPVGY